MISRNEIKDLNSKPNENNQEKEIENRLPAAIGAGRYVSPTILTRSIVDVEISPAERENSGSG